MFRLTLVKIAAAVVKPRLSGPLHLRDFGNLSKSAILHHMERRDGGQVVAFFVPLHGIAIRNAFEA